MPQTSAPGSGKCPGVWRVRAPERVHLGDTVPCVRGESRGGVHRDHDDHPFLTNCPYGPVMSKMDLAAEKLKIFGGLK
eukprot:1315618-Alexandrium_andersonii.AAC.1